MTAEESYKLLEVITDDAIFSEGGRVFALMSDTFAYACADAEEITAADLDDITKALDDVRRVTGKHNIWQAMTLWAARKRGCLPLAALLARESAEVQALYAGI